MKDSQPSLSRRRRDIYKVRNCTTTIPFDLIIDILSLLPAKSLLRFQSVSKLWFSTIRSKSFAASFLARSKTCPRLFFTFYFRKSLENFFFSAPEHDNNNDDKSSSVMARHDMTISDPDAGLICGIVNGFVCFKSFASFEDGDVVCYTITVYNPTTRQIVKLPDVELNGRHMTARLGYDPVEDQYKVLCAMMFSAERQDTQQEHFVCTLSSSQKLEWRKIENPAGDDYFSVYGGTCIDGCLYYGVGRSRIVRFDVRSEKIDFIKTPEESSISTTYESCYLNYNGKLGGVDYSRKKELMTLWILEDAEKQEWLSMKYDLSSRWEYLFKRSEIVSKGVIHTGELMLFRPMLKSSKPFYVCYYDFNKKSTRRVEIRGIEDGDLIRFHGIDVMLCFPGHVENIRFL